MKRTSFAILLLLVLLVTAGGCRTPHYYTRYKMKNHVYDQHYNPYRTKWYKWSYSHGAI